MRTSYWIVLTLAISAVCLVPAIATSRESLSLSFGVYTSDKPTVMYRKFKPILGFLEKHLRNNLKKPVKIKLQIFNSYESAIKALVDEEVDFVRFGTASYVLAKRENPEITLLAVEESRGKRRSDGVIFCRSDRSIQSLGDLKGKTFAFGDQNSTIGRYLSQAELVKAGVHAGDLSRFEYLGRHDLVVTAVLHERFDAGAAKEGTFLKYKDRGLRAVARFDNVTKPWVAREGLTDKTLSSLREGLLGAKDSKVLTSIGRNISGFGTVEDSEYEFVRQGMDRAKEFETGSTASPSRATAAAEKRGRSGEK